MPSCQICKTPFEITPEEIKFLDKIAPTINGKRFPIPAPEACPDCRLASRTVQRNEQFFYHHKSAISGKPLISLYSPDAPWSKDYKIYSHEEWWSDQWDGLDFGRDVDFSRPFFEQFHELDLQIPRVNLIQINNENSPYSTGTGYCKNCYLINCSENCEDCYYGKLMQGSRDIMNSDYIYDSELLYECFYLTRCYNCKYLSYSQNCSDCLFSENLKSCKNCFLCTNLNNKEYYFMNQPLKKEEYEAKVKEWMKTSAGIEKAKKTLAELRTKRIHKYANIINCENCTGDFLTNSKNCTDSFDVNDSEDCKYVTVGVNVKDLYDCSNMYLKPELNYQVLGTIGTYNVIFSIYIFHSQNVMYSQFCFNSKELFGCSGLRNKKYCILNKQYSPEEYEKMVARIIEHMGGIANNISQNSLAPASARREPEYDIANNISQNSLAPASARHERGGFEGLGLVGPKPSKPERYDKEWGKFFPTQHSPFGYNESVAQEYLPLTKEQALAKDFHWKDADKREYKPQTYIVPAEIKDVNEEILNQILACVSCGKNYKVIAAELKKLKKMQLPIPRLCPDCRHIERMKMRSGWKIYSRACAKCAAGIQTTYAPERPETVYCEKCYIESM